MRIKIIGDNNCARATRHLLRLAGFAVTEFLPADVILSAPHSGYAITIETAAENSSSQHDHSARTLNKWAASTAHTPLAPAPQPLNAAVAPSAGALASVPACEPDSSTLGQPAMLREETSRTDRDVSSPAFFSETLDAEILLGLDEGRQAEACPTGHIHFDSVDGALEAAVLRHVSRMTKVPVMVDRPGGVVHSERELRIVVPCTGDEKADESAAVAVEFGVLRGLLDLTRHPSQNELSGAAAGAGGAADSAGDDSEEMAKAGGVRSSGSRWWFFGVAFFVLAAVFGVLVAQASACAPPRPGQPKPHRLKPVPPEAILHLFADPTGNLHRHGIQRAGEPRAPGFKARGNNAQRIRLVGLRARGGRLALVRPAALFAAAAAAPAATAATAAANPAPAAQGQFATGQAVKIFDGTNTLIVDPCKGQTKLFVSINQTANAQLATGTAAKKIYICSIHVVVAAATSVALVEGTGTVCATGTTGVSGFGGATAATGWTFMANGGIALGSGDAAVGVEGTAADNLCLFNSGSGQVSGGISYVVQ